MVGTDDTPIAVNDTLSGFVKEDIASLSAISGTAAGVLGNDIDIGHTISVFNVNGSTGNVGNAVAGTYGALTLNADGAYSYLINNALSSTQALGQGQTVFDTFTYNIIDELGATSVAAATITVSVVGTNDTPIAVNDTLSGFVKEDIASLSAISGTAAGVLVNDTDVDTGHTLSVFNVNGDRKSVV